MFLDSKKRDYFLHSLIVVICVASFLQAKVIYKNDTVKNIAEVKSGTRIDSVKLLFTLPELLNEHGRYSINSISKNNIDNGSPDIPIVEKLIRVESKGEIKIKIISLTNKSIDSPYPKPFRLPVSQSGLIAPEKYDTAAYNFFKTTDPVYIKSIEVVGDYRVARVAFSPVRYNSEGVFQIIRSAEVLITTSNNSSESDFQRGVGRLEKRYAPFYKNILNVDGGDVRREGENIVPTYCFIGNDETLDAVEELINWKIRKGLNVIIANTSDIGSSYNQIDSWIESTYQTVDGLMFVLLVGDEDIIASNSMNCPYSQVKSPSDNAYGVIGSGYHPTVHVGRLTTADKGISVHEYQAWKIVKYESEPEEGPWMASAETWGCSSPNGQPSASYWQDILEGAGMSCNMELEAYGAAKGMTLVGHFNEGLTTFSMKGHGNDQSWASASIGQSQVSSMSNGMKQPWINNIACLNSRFQYSYYTCFAEAMMTTGEIGNAKGCIGMYSYTISSSGGIPTQGSDGMLTAIYEGLLEEDMRHVGVAASYGTAASGTTGDKKGSMVWGCPEMDIYYKYPLDTISVECQKPVPGSFLVETDVEGALVSVVTQEYEALASGYTDANGDVTLDLPGFSAPTYLTVTARNCVPILKEYDATPLTNNLLSNKYSSPEISINNDNLVINISQEAKYNIRILDLKGRTLFNEIYNLKRGNTKLSLKDKISSNQTIIVEIKTPDNKKVCKSFLFI